MGDDSSSDWSMMGDDLAEAADALRRLTQILPGHILHCNVVISGMALIERRLTAASSACRNYHETYSEAYRHDPDDALSSAG